MMVFWICAQVQAMNAAIEKGSQEENIQEKDAESRRFLKETPQNYTDAPWEIGMAGQQVSLISRRQCFNMCAYTGFLNMLKNKIAVPDFGAGLQSSLMLCNCQLFFLMPRDALCKHEG